MVIALGPGKFYGSSLPRPRFYSDVKLNETRIDPPVHVMDPLMKWAESAHWSMGGLSFVRHRLQGRIEGKVENLRKQNKREESAKRSTKSPKDKDESETRVVKRRRAVGLVDEEERCVARKLGDEFEKIAMECGMVTRSSSKKAFGDCNNSDGKGGRKGWLG